MSKNTINVGLGLSEILTIIFIVLKLVGAIDWSWWWVFSPTLIDAGLIVIIFTVFFIYEVHDNKKYGFTSKKGKK
jgi:hypothetical protein